MTAVKALNAARAAQIDIWVDGDDLVPEALSQPPNNVVDLLCRHKLDIVALLGDQQDNWSAEDWRAHFDERAGISRDEAERLALEDCVVEWLNRHQEPSDPGSCAWCRKSEPNEHIVVPFGTKPHGHTWLHPECWTDWFRHRQERARIALCGFGIPSTSCSDDAVGLA